MMKPLLIVLAIGAVIGLMVPDGNDAAPPPPAAEAAMVSPDAPAKDTVLEKRSNGHFYVDAYVNGQLVNFVVDTGASFVALTVEDAQRIGVPFAPSEFTIVGQGASGPVRGKTLKLASISVDGKSVTDVQGAVLEGLPVSLLGQSYLSRFSAVQMSGDSMTLK